MSFVGGTWLADRPATGQQGGGGGGNDRDQSLNMGYNDNGTCLRRTFYRQTW